MESSIYTQWLSNYVDNELHEVVAVYIEAMNEDVDILSEHINDKNNNTTLNILHRIKGGAAAIGFNYIYLLAKDTHALGTNKDDEYKESLKKLILEIKTSIYKISNIPLKT